MLQLSCHNQPGLRVFVRRTTLEPRFSNPYNSKESQTMSPMQSFAGHNPLTDDEFARLDSFLCKNMKAMNLEEIDGFFTALVCGPEVVMPGEYLPYVWGNEKSLDGVLKISRKHRRSSAFSVVTGTRLQRPCLKAGCVCRSCTKMKMGR